MKCKKCGTDYPAESFRPVKVKGKLYANPWCKSCIQNAGNETRARALVQVLHGYGAKCSCPGCDVTEIACLSLDHVNGDGKKHREQIGASTYQLTKWVIENNFPDTIQVLCYNCHYGRHRNNGICPLHKSSVQLDLFHRGSQITLEDLLD